MPMTFLPGADGVMRCVPRLAVRGGRAAGATSRKTRRGQRSAFEAPEGPPAVIEPPDEPADHDPGPGVIGIDR